MQEKNLLTGQMKQAGEALATKGKRRFILLWAGGCSGLLQ